MTCHLLSLPPELRNIIYEYIFFETSAEVVDLLSPAPPTKALLLTCREIRNESSSMYKQAYRTYWSEKRFCLHRPEDIKEIRKFADGSPGPRELAHIKSLEFGTARPSLPTYRDGLWIRRDATGDEMQMIALPLGKKGKVTPEEVFACKHGFGYDADVGPLFEVVRYELGDPDSWWAILLVDETTGTSEQIREIQEFASSRSLCMDEVEAVCLQEA